MTTQTSRLVIEIDSRNAERNTRAVANELENLTTKGFKADAQMTEMSSSIKTLVGFMSGLLTINKAIAMADGYTQMAARIRNATDSAEEYTLVQDRLLANANTTYRQLGEAQEVYLSMAGGMKSLGKTTKDTLDLTDSLSFSFTHNATRVDQAQSAMDALSKSMAKGKVDGDAWISIVTGADNVIADMAKTTGKTEAEIRKLGAEGKVSLEDLIRTLIATREQNEKLANNMENSLADGFTKLSNEVTVYLGKANEATSATGMLAGGLSGLADNLEAIANTGAVLGIGYVTSALLTKGAAVKASIVLSAQKQVADRAEIASQAQLSALEVQRTRQVTALAAQEVHLARLELNSALTRTERAAATMRLTQAEVALALAEKQKTAATLADTAAQNANNAARSRGAMLLGLVGGPIGAITVGVMALSAGYAYMSHRTAEANAKLEEQGKIAQKTDEELRKLAGNDKKSAVEDLTAAFNAQNAELAKSKESVDAVLFAIRAASAENEKARKVTEDARRGVISYDEAIKQLNAMDIPTDLYEMLKKQAKEYDNNANKAGNSQRVLKILGIEVKLTGNAAQNSVGQFNAQAGAMDGAASSAQTLAEKLADVNKGLSSDVFSAKLQNAFEKQGKSAQSASRWTEVYNENTKKGFKGVTIEQKKMLDQLDAVDRQREARLKAQSDAQKSSLKASKDSLSQQKKDAKEADRLKEEQYDLRERIAYDYKDRILKIEKDLENEVADIQKANFSPKDTAGYIQNAKNRADLEKQLYVAQLAEDVSAWRLSEERKLELKKTVNDLTIQLNGDMNDDFKNQALQSSEDQYLHELGLIKLAKEQRIFQAEQAMMTEVQAMQERYRLEREEIAKTANISDDEKVRRLSASQFNQKKEETDLTKSLTQEYMGVMGFEENPLIQQFEVLQKARENDLINEEEYQNAKLQLQAKSTASYMEGMFGGFAELVDENSKTYAVLFAAQKAFAVAQAMLNIPAAYSKAYDAVVGTPYVGPYIAPAIGAAAAALQVVQAASIKNVSMSGFATGGFTGIGGKFDPAGIVHKGEVVWSQEDIKRWGGVNVVEAMRTSQPPKGYSDGGLVTPKDTYRVGMGTVDAINRGADVQAERQAQANVRAQAASPQPIESNVRVGIFDDRDDMMNQMYGREGEKVVMYHLKRNGMLKA